MPRVRFANLGREAELELGTSLLEAARSVGVPEADRCGGVCACSTCHVYVDEGLELLTEPSAAEVDLLSLSAQEPRESSRLGCQARIVAEGELVVRLTEESFRAYLDQHPEDAARALELWVGGKR